MLYESILLLELTILSVSLFPVFEEGDGLMEVQNRVVGDTNIDRNFRGRKDMDLRFKK